jgi:hypothetical protein
LNDGSSPLNGDFDEATGWTRKLTAMPAEAAAKFPDLPLNFRSLLGGT